VNVDGQPKILQQWKDSPGTINMVTKKFILCENRARHNTATGLRSGIIHYTSFERLMCILEKTILR
jgi:hypothetical protein